MTEGKLRVGWSLSQVFLVLMGILMLYLVVDFGRQVLASHQRREDLQRLETLVIAAQEKKAMLEERLEYDRSTGAAEAWARGQGWVKPNEVPVVLLVPESASPSAAQESAQPGVITGPSQEAWWSLFFGDR